jgi:hypothetical protein
MEVKHGARDTAWLRSDHAAKRLPTALACVGGVEADEPEAGVGTFGHTIYRAADGNFGGSIVDNNATRGAAKK